MTTESKTDVTGAPPVRSSAWLDLVGKGFRTILADPPWTQGMSGQWKKHKAAKKLPYPTMTLDEICGMPVGELAADDCHLWLWTTNSHLEAGCMMSGLAWNKNGITVETGRFVALPIGEHDALRLAAILADEINIGDTPENALALCKLPEPINLISIYEVGTIDTTIFLQEYTHGRASNKETAG